MVEIEGAFAAGTLRLINIWRRRIHDRANLVRGFADHDEVIHSGVQYWVQRLAISINALARLTVEKNELWVTQVHAKRERGEQFAAARRECEQLV